MSRMVIKFAYSKIDQENFIEMKYQHSLINLTPLFILLTFVLFSCNNIIKNQNPINKSISDTILTHSQKFKSFEYNILEIKSKTSDTKYQCFIQYSNTDKSYFLFETTPEYKNEKLKHLYSNYYAFPYFTGGNYCRALGINIIKITKDTTFFIGPVSGYADIDSNGTKELYIDVATDLAGAHVNHKIEQFEVFLVNDSLVYQEIDLY